MTGASAYLRHLRLPFQLTLAPIFLWGVLLSGGGWDWQVTAAFLSLHLFLYPAATALNAAFDRDEGPLAGMAEPPPVPPRLAFFALMLGIVGAFPAAAAGGAFLFLYGLIAFWTAAYSLPATRWKASPWKSAAAIALGQGAVGFLAGWAAAAPLRDGAVLLAVGAASAAFTALGLYPVTQVFQVDEDRARGDRTLAVALGPAGALRLGALLLLVGGGGAAWAALQRFGLFDGAIVAAGYAALGVALVWFARILPRLDAPRIYRRASVILNAATAAFLLFLAAKALLG